MTRPRTEVHYDARGRPGPFVIPPEGFVPIVEGAGFPERILPALAGWARPARAWEFVVLGPPVPCARVRVVSRQAGKKTRAVTPDRTRAYEKHVGMLGLAARPRDWKADAAAYGIRLDVYRAESRGDADNFLKAVVDGLTGIAWKDDAAVVRMAARVFLDRERPRAHVTVELL